MFCFSIGAPKVQVYSRMPGELGKANTLICHVSSFYPPEIEIELLKNNEVIPSAKQTDLTFEENWHYHLTKHVPFIPGKGEMFACRVTHLGSSKLYHWGTWLPVSHLYDSLAWHSLPPLCNYITVLRSLQLINKRKTRRNKSLKIWKSL